MNIFKYIIFLGFLISCGTKNKVAVNGQVTVPTQYEVKHKFSYDVTAIEDACEEKFESEHDVDKCIEDKELIMQQLFNVLSGKQSTNN